MRITESRLRQIVREELTGGAASVANDDSARSSRLGDNTQRRLTFEGLLHDALVKAVKSLGVPEKDSIFTVKYSILSGSYDPLSMPNLTEVIKISSNPIIGLRLDFEPEASAESYLPASGVALRLADLIDTHVSQMFPDGVNSDNAKRLASIKSGSVKVYVIPPESQTPIGTGLSGPSTTGTAAPTPSVSPVPASVPTPSGALSDPLEYTVKRDDTLGKIVEKFYGLPYSATRVPLYNWLSKNFMTPTRPNPNEIVIGDKIRLPAVLTFRDKSTVKRKNVPTQ